MSKTLSLTRFREDCEQVLDHIEKDGGTVTLLRNGRPAAVVLSAKEYERLMDAFDLLYEPGEDLAVGDDSSENFYL